MLVPKLTIAGKPVTLGKYGDHSFVRPLGVNAPMMIWCLPPDVADTVLALEYTEIEMATAGMVTPQKWKRVKVVREHQSDHPIRRYVVLSDVRWELPGIYIKATYNLRTSSAETELIKVDGTPLEIDPIASVVTYAASSLKDGLTPWTADQILDDVVAKVNAALAAKGIKLTLKRATTRNFGNYAPNDVQLDGPGNISLMHALAAVGGVDTRVTDDGDLELVDALMGAERDLIEKWISYSLLGRGLMRWISQPNVQPVKVQVGFDSEMEVRGDGWLPAPGAATPDVGSYPTFDNVIQNTDRQLVVTELGRTYTSVIGSYVPVDPWFAAVAADQVVKAPPVPNQVTWTRDYACFDYLRGLMEFWFVSGNTGGLEPSNAWQARHAAMKANFLKSWRLNPRFAKLCQPGTIRPVRAQLLDAANQTRQPSAYFADWCRRPSIRGTRDDPKGGWNKHSIPGTPAGQKVGATKAYSDPAFPLQVVALDSCTQSPAEVRLVDPIAGIFKIGFRKDTHDNSAEVVPALVRELPTNDLDQVNRGAGISYWEQCQIVKTHRMVLVFTAVPAAAPLYYCDVTPQAALAKLGVNVTVNPKRAPFQLRTGPALQTARFAYTDADRQNIQNIFEGKDAANLLQRMTPLNLAILQDYATAVAAVLYAALLDHYEGEQEIEFTPEAMPLGSLQSVIHTMYADGKVFTKFVCRQVQPPVQPIHFMERGARAVVFRSPGSYQ